MQSMPGSNPSRQEILSEGEQLDGPTVEQLLCSLENSRNESEAVFSTSVESCKMPGRRMRHPTKRMKHRKHSWNSISHQVHKLRQKEQRYPDTRKRQKFTSPKKRQKLRKIPGPATKVEAQKECGQASPRQGIWCQMSN